MGYFGRFELQKVRIPGKRRCACLRWCAIELSVDRHWLNWESAAPPEYLGKEQESWITSLNNVEPKIILIRKSLKHRPDTGNLLFHRLYRNQTFFMPYRTFWESIAVNFMRDRGASTGWVFNTRAFFYWGAVQYPPRPAEITRAIPKTATCHGSRAHVRD
jgi:hypothetical protein